MSNISPRPLSRRLNVHRLVLDSTCALTVAFNKREYPFVMLTNTIGMSPDDMLTFDEDSSDVILMTSGLVGVDRT